MTIDNGERIVAMRLAGFISTLVYVLFVFVAYFPKIFRNILADETLNVITGAVSALYLLMMFWPALMKYRYINFSSDERHITLRWYKTGLLPGDSMSIEIPSDRFAGFEMNESLFGLRCDLKLYQWVRGQKAGYNAVSISALRKKQRERLRDTLSGYKSVS